jgi:hypothetical protein
MNFKPLPIGVENFKTIIEKDYYYVDKTLLIKELIDNRAPVNLFTRPRRFGKTLNISMLKYFFENGEADNSNLFNKLKIMSQGDKYTSEMGQYPVINLSLKSAKQPTFELAYECLLNEITEEFRRHDYVLNSDKLSYEKEAYLKVAYKKEQMSGIVTSLKFLSKCLSIYHNKKVIILIDEYDVPLENAFFRGFYNEMIDFIRSIFESALKTNEHLEFAVLTGCLRISRESIFTGLNNLNIISILNNHYDEYFGFKDSEVIEILKYYNLEHKAETLKNWYNGYLFGKTNVYNPWSTIKYIYDLRAADDAMLSCDAETFELELVDLLTESISFYDAYENFYHGFLLGTLVNMKRYIIKSNRETGKGRSDIIIRYPNRRGAAVILELKVAKNIRQLEAKCDEALQQIEDKGYDKPLIEEGYTNILKYGITFYKKDCMIKKFVV